ncbi:MAG TPA: hypothetical protein VK509_03885 [Polyangiales bacterium]|nr:hypothetical protein [Polyangiales bacterium]
MTINTGDTRGAVMVEYLIAFLPVLLLFASGWQLADLYASQLIVARAASAAGRAATVVLPDDPYYYDGAEVDSFTGARRSQIILAAELVLQASPRILGNPTVDITGASGIGPLTATVVANYRCFPGWGVAVCGADGRVSVTGRADYPYHGATYQY